MLKEEKRNLLRQVDELSKTNLCNESALHRHRSQSFSEQRGSQRNPKNAVTPTRDMGTMCGVMTRDVGVSHQQVRRRLPFHADLSALQICFVHVSTARETRVSLENRHRTDIGEPWKNLHIQAHRSHLIAPTKTLCLYIYILYRDGGKVLLGFEKLFPTGELKKHSFYSNF